MWYFGTPLPKEAPLSVQTTHASEQSEEPTLLEPWLSTCLLQTLTGNWTQSQVTSHPTQYTQQLAGMQLKFLRFLPSSGRDDLVTVREVINN